MFAKVLIANRGEIACRVIRTARRMGIRTVVVHTDADARGLPVKLADEARRVESYLDIKGILAAARDAGAQSVHPGYGFLAENEKFAAACATAGLVFIGPSPDAIAAMGDKSAAKRLMEKAGVPLVPGYHDEAQDPATLEREAERLGFPVLIKPSAGGGGKGMRVVAARNEFRPALEAAQREARAAFGDERVLIERYLQRPRHIEVQVFGDRHGNVVHLFERDCSVQRRHQKVIEEAPAPGLSAERRREMGAAAVAAAKAIGYGNAGTVEFIAEPDGRFYFMEMNTRLQVEHPVTEMITGLDLVELQFRVAAGEALPFAQKDLSISGHAIEARLYAEDPQRDFIPASGRLVHLAFPSETSDVRIDTGVEAGSEISPWYDPMIAKLVVRGENRRAALSNLRKALSEVEIAGVANNVAFLKRFTGLEAFRSGEVDTGIIERHRSALLSGAEEPSDALLVVAAVAELNEEERVARERAASSDDPHSPWQAVDGWRLNEDSHHDFVFLEGERAHALRIRFTDHQLQAHVRGRDLLVHHEPLDDDGRFRMRIDGHSFTARAVREGSTWHVFADGESHSLTPREPLQGKDEDVRLGSLAAPMPGRIAKVLTQPGTKVKKGDPLVILEAMKMEHTITAPADGVVKEVHYTEGEQVIEGAELVTLE